jgi:RNA recognition motif-containing protein
MWTRKNRGNVFVGNLPRDFSDERLAEAFDPYGLVLTASVARDPETGEKLRYGFVDIASERAATAAINALNGSVVDGCKLNVKPSEKPARKPAGAGAPRRPMRPGARAPMGQRSSAPRPSPAGPSSPPHPEHHYPEHHYPAARSLREPQRAAAVEEQPPSPGFAPAPASNPAERPFQVQVVRRRTPNFQVERRPLPRRV